MPASSSVIAQKVPLPFATAAEKPGPAGNVARATSRGSTTDRAVSAGGSGILAGTTSVAPSARPVAAVRSAVQSRRARRLIERDESVTERDMATPSSRATTILRHATGAHNA